MCALCSYVTACFCGSMLSTDTGFPFKLPSSGDLWSIHVDFDTKRLDPWERIIPTFKYSKEVPFFEMLVPTTDTVRYGYLMEKLLAVKHSVLFTGTTGVGKVGKRPQVRSAIRSEGLWSWGPRHWK